MTGLIDIRKSRGPNQRRRARNVWFPPRPSGGITTCLVDGDAWFETHIFSIRAELDVRDELGTPFQLRIRYCMRTFSGLRSGNSRADCEQ